MPGPIKTKDAKKVLEFDITTHTKGFIAQTTIDGSDSVEYFQFKEIHQVIHHPNVGVEIVNYNQNHRVFYSDEVGVAQTLFDEINTALQAWMNSNLN